MKRLLLVFALSVSSAFADSTPISLIPFANQRVWQMAFGSSRTVDWRWKDTAVKALLTVNDLVANQTAAPAEVVRVANARTGSFQLPMATSAIDSGEGLLEVTLQQLDDEDTVLESRTARLAFLPTAVTVCPDNSRFGRMSGRRPVAFDAAWADASAAATATFVPQAGGDPVVSVFDSASGWFVQNNDTGSLTVSFAGFSGVLAADLVLRGGLLMIIR